MARKDIDNVKLLDKEYSKYLSINSDANHIGRLTDVLDRLWLQPEFRAKCEEAYNNKKEKLQISYDDRQVEIGYGLPVDVTLDTHTQDEIYDLTKSAQDHHIAINSNFIIDVKYIGIDGKRYVPSLERIIAHEVYHSADSTLTHDIYLVYARREEWQDRIVEQQKFTDHITLCNDWLNSDYKHMSPDERSAFVEGLYDKYAQAGGDYEKLVDKYVSDSLAVYDEPQIKAYISV